MNERQYNDTNRGVMFRNTFKQNEKQPDLRGKLNIEGKEYELVCWVKMSQKGREFYSLSVKEKPASDDSDIPWSNK